MTAVAAEYIRQHLIDPSICTRCNTCESSCPIGAITHDVNNYVVKAEVCNGCLECTWGCPTGAIDSWRTVPRAQAFSIEQQFSWRTLPEALAIPEDAAIAVSPAPTSALRPSAPHSAASAAENLFTLEKPASARLVGNERLTTAHNGSDIHHIVLDFGAQHFPVLEGQNIGILPPGVDANGRPHAMRSYSIASARDGETAGGNEVALTIKRVVEDHEGKPTKGVASTYVCDLPLGSEIKVVGPFGGIYLMPNHPGSHLLMICTGTGIAPMRAMIERRKRVPVVGRQVLFYGGRAPEDMAYHDELVVQAQHGLELHTAYSRVPGRPKQYVQDGLRAKATDIAALLRDEQTHLYVCGLKSMEEGILDALKDICTLHGLDWEEVKQQMRGHGRVHFETY